MELMVTAGSGVSVSIAIESWSVVSGSVLTSTGAAVVVAGIAWAAELAV